MLRIFFAFILCSAAATSQELRVTGGVADDQVLQRGASGRADIHLSGTARGADGRKVEACLLRKFVPLEGFEWAPVAAIARDSWSAELKNIPAGGPYRLELRIANTDTKVAIQNILVGDLWVLAGQSNMEGNGALADLDQPNTFVHSFDMADHWLVAEDPLHLSVAAADRVHWEQDANHTPYRLERGALRKFIADRRQGAGLGLPFAVEMVRREGVPIGLIPCAHGGTSMNDWDPALKDKDGDSLYGAMIRRVRAAGGKVRGVLWYQGESDAFPQATGAFPEKFKRLVSSIREDFNQPDLPFYYVQISRHVSNENVDPWNVIQELQLEAELAIPHCGMVAAIDLPLDDEIHISTQGLKRLSVRLARLALGLPRGPRPVSATLLPASSTGFREDRIRVNFSDVNGKLEAPDRIAGFSIHASTGELVPIIYDTQVDRTDGRALLLYLKGKLPANAVLRYGYGKDPYCNLKDSADLAAPAFGPMEIR
jgi:sialate O-acetylesterase